MNIGEAVRILDRELDGLRNALAAPFFSDLYIPYHKKFVDMRSSVIREFHVHYSTYPFVVLGTPLIRGVRTVAESVDLSRGLFHIRTLKLRGSSHSRTFPGSFVTWGNIRPLPENSLLPGSLGFLWNFAVLRAKPLAVPRGKTLDRIYPTPLSLVTIVDEDEPLVVAPFSAVFVLEVTERSVLVPHLPSSFYAREAKVYAFVSDGKRVRFDGPFPTFVPDFEDFQLDVTPGRAVLGHYIGLAVFPVDGRFIGPITKTDRPLQSGYFLILDELPFDPELYYVLNFGRSAGEILRVAQVGDFEKWYGSFERAVEDLAKRVSFERELAWGLPPGLSRKPVARIEGELVVPEPHFALRIAATGEDPFDESVWENPFRPLDLEVEIPHPKALARISSKADYVVRELLNAGVRLLV